MATTPTQVHPLLTLSIDPNADFTVLADYCEQFAEAQAEFDFPGLRSAFCERLTACLACLGPRRTTRSRLIWNPCLLLTLIPSFFHASSPIRNSCAATVWRCLKPSPSRSFPLM